MTTTTHRTDEAAGTEQASARWRTVDIVVASALGGGVGGGVWGW
jgi:hypothetical protein